MSTLRVRQQFNRAFVRGRRFVIVASRFNPAVTQPLADAAMKTLRKAGALPQDIRLIWVSGAFELPAAAARALKNRPRASAVIALGTLIRGETVQYEVIANAVAQGLMHLSVTTGVPVGFGVIVADNLKQARQRSTGKGNRGCEAAEAVLSILTTG